MADPGHLLWKRMSKQDLLQQLFVDEDGLQQAANTTQMRVKGFIDDESKSIRNSMIVLGIFNLLATVSIASIILYDSHRASKRHGNKRKFYSIAVHPAETFPLILAICNFIQGLIFLRAQSSGLSSLFVDGCTLTSQLVFPAIFVIPYVHIVFGVECAARALKKTVFPARRRFAVPIILGVVLLMLVCTSIPTWIWPQKGSCFGSLAWFVWRYGREGLILVVVSLAIVAISTGIIFYRLTTIAAIDQQERIAASRMVYYQMLAVILLILLMPWFVALVMGKPTLDNAMVATATLNLYGIMTAALQIFLRSNTAAMAIMPQDTPGWSRRAQLRIWGPNELGFDAHLLEPVSGPRTPGSTRSRASSTASEKRSPRSMESSRIPETGTSPKEMEQVARKPVPVSSEKSEGSLPTIPNAVAALRKKKCGHERKQSYSLFPHEVNSPGTNTQPGPLSGTPVLNKLGRVLDDAPVEVSSSPRSQKKPREAVYAADDLLLLPPPLRVMGASNHRRDSSMASSATVQIGLRLSNVVDDLPETSSLKNHSLELPLRLQTTNLIIPADPSLYPSPLQRSATTGSPLSPLSPAMRAARMKTLPPIPRGSTASALAEVHAKPKLSPTVYNPQSAREMVKSPLREQLLSPDVPRNDSPNGAARRSQGSWI